MVQEPPSDRPSLQRFSLTCGGVTPASGHTKRTFREALSRLRGRSAYDTDIGGNVTSFRPGAISLVSIHSARPLQDLVIPEMRGRLGGTCERTTASDNEMGVPPRPFWSSLGGERHVTFLQTPRRRGMLRYTLHLVEEAGVFFRCHEAGLPTAHHRRTRESRLQRPNVRSFLRCEARCCGWSEGCPRLFFTAS